MLQNPNQIDKEYPSVNDKLVSEWNGQESLENFENLFRMTTETQQMNDQLVSDWKKKDKASNKRTQFEVDERKVSVHGGLEPTTLNQIKEEN